ncbi:hypothetical protein ACQR1W_16105 [Bradyrhizobium sp. HKCCYLS1011]|uniref:hypothetical protein n=1 Tax=Bradyrhizobium sp. HKCCYLS1011 TaxID=3420733 RepID=UPI003EBB2467
MLRRAKIYIGATVREAIIAALHHNNAGICFEQDNPEVVADWRQGSGLAVALRSALERFSAQERNLRSYKKKQNGPAIGPQILALSARLKPLISALAFKH